MELRNRIRYRLSADAVFAWEGAKHDRLLGEGVTRDISLMGAFIFTATCPPVGAQVQLDVFLSPTPGAARKTVRIKTEATVIRVEHSAGSEGFAAVSQDFTLLFESNRGNAFWVSSAGQRRPTEGSRMTTKGMLLVILVSILAPLAHARQDGPKASPTDQARRPSTAAERGDGDGVDHPGPQKRDWRYQLRPGDSFSIRFPFTPEFNQGDVAVQPDGYVTLQGLGEVSVAGKTLPELRKVIETSYSAIVSQQIITVELKEFEKPYFLVGGEVGHAGKFELRGDTTVAEAVMIAGGFRETAKHSQVLLFRRVSDQWMEAKKLDLKKMLSAGNLGEDLHLRPGDMIYVPKNAISKIKPFLPVPGVGVALTPTY
jgi:polysaccharide export outer membrane protein